MSLCLQALGGKWQNFVDLRYKNINPRDMVNYVISHYMARMLNFR